MDFIRSRIRDIPDFPKPGILFRDITPLLADPAGLKATINALCEPLRENPPALLVGIESRGFIFAAAMAYELGCGCALIRKPGKLPGRTISQSYSLEYGEDSIEIHADAVASGQRVVLVDDLLATGGTMQAASNLIRKLGGDIVEFLFVIELEFLKGREKLEGAPIRTLVTY